MENKLDKLFRDKLEHHAITPSVNAWERVAAGFPKKNSKAVWVWRMAAVMALAMLAGGVFILLSPNQQQKIASASTQPIDDNNQRLDSNKLVETETRKEVITNQTESQPSKNQRTPKNTSIEPLITQVSNENQSIELNTTAPTETPTLEVNDVAVTPEEIQPQTEQPKTRVIVYTLAAVESTPAEDAIKSKPFQRMLTLAKEVKSGETTLASVRQWKDNFLGMDETTHMEKTISNN